MAILNQSKATPKVKAGAYTGAMLVVVLSAISVTLEAVNPTMFAGLGVWAVPASLFVVALGQGIAAYLKQDRESFSPAELQEAVEAAVTEAVKEYAEAELRRKLHVAPATSAPVAPATEDVTVVTENVTVVTENDAEYVKPTSAVG